MKLAWDKWYEILYDTWGIACTVAFLAHFACIGILGQFYIAEPNPVIYWVEVSGFVAFLIMGIGRLVNDVREIKCQ